MRLLSLFAVFPFVFLAIKLSQLGIRISDTNVYFYTAYEILKGKILYKDIFFTNFPLFPYVSSFYLMLSKGNINWYYATAVLEVVLSSMLIANIVYKKSKKIYLSLLSQVFYLFSFIILTTSDHQSGVFLASLLSLIAYEFYDKKRFIISGIFLGLMIMVKAYYFPIAAAFFLHLLLKQKNKIPSFSLGVIISILATLAFFISVAGEKLVADVFHYSLFRSQGISKGRIFSFFILNDPLLFLAFCYSFFQWRKNLLLVIIGLFSFILLIFYQDIYYLYLNLLVPFLVFSFSDAMIKFEDNLKQGRLFIVGTICLFILVGFTKYMSSYANLQKIEQIEKLVKIIKKESPDFIYGSMGIAPALAYLSDTPLLEGVIDTNDNLFYKGVLNAKHMTRAVFRHKTMVVSTGSYYPGQGVDQQLSEAIFDKELIENGCDMVESLAVKAEGIINRINLFKCY
ncbi:MAG: hypothetical protein US11_C0007G0024 [Candidatus Roizmanbacteria bacterium GW2011_GWA2_36_23]|uniref:Glycosyltransferase RgtA/B/C/D-like domain-containing protein n=1 Tax=Candidatus Roizmanbacteria bacterium GW2011_GWA2_36_23 TaxID=1618480 RepID=A0A0G0HC90_9BACT|nr:MAG: hypothetical protein US11_C0007G0024 [Candidatus Roizmanbacteria bacterium GW2011_GWA2_36_23]